MTREWKPGDVAMTAKNTVALCHNGGQMIDQGGAPWSDDRFPDNLRPLVVIDPEGDDIERLRSDLINSGWIPDSDADALDDILRHFAAPTPPKPDEPQGLGAVVEDADGTRWVRVPVDGNSQQTEWVCSHSTCRNWDAIAAVRILSEGVRP